LHRKHIFNVFILQSVRKIKNVKNVKKRDKNKKRRKRFFYIYGSRSVAATYDRLVSRIWNMFWITSII